MIDRVDELREAVAERDVVAGAYPTPYGEVRIRSMEFHEDLVEVWLEGETAGGDAHFRIVNPPLLVEDPNGDVILANGRFRRDPVAAITYVIGSMGGAIKRKDRRKR